LLSARQAVYVSLVCRVAVTNGSDWISFCRLPAMTIDKPLKKPIEAGLIPGVVAVAADDRASFTKARSDDGRSTKKNQ
jgi:hypothetical protein